MDSLFYAVAAVGRALVQGVGRAVEAAKAVADGAERDRDLDHGSGYASAFAEDRTSPDESGHRFREEWKERLVYEEDGRTYEFDCGWGVTPRVVYVPSAAYWPKATPAWMRDRRDEILDRLRHGMGGRYVVEEDEEPDRSPG